MNIMIQTLHFKASAALEDLIREKLNKIDHHTEGIISANVTLTKGPDSEPDNNYCEIMLDMPGKSPFVKKHSDKFEHAITEAVDAIHAMVSKNKDKDVTRRHVDIV